MHLRQASKNLFLTALLVICVGVATAFAQVESKKEFNDTYKVRADDLLSVANKYGNVVVNLWGKNEINVMVSIKAWASSKEKADKLLATIDIEKMQNGSMVIYETQIESHNVSIGKNSGFEINYTVNMPATNPIKVGNKYGSVYLGDFASKADVEVAYGNFTGGKISSKEFNLNLRYGNATAVEFNKVFIDAAYAGKINIDKANDLSVDGRYSNLHVGTAARVDADLAYTGIDINRLTGRLNVTTKYGNVEVDQVAESCTAITSNAAYGSVSLDFDETADYSFTADIRYGNFSHSLGSSSVNINEVSHTQKKYSGSKGSGKGCTVTVTSAYGNVKFGTN